MTNAQETEVLFEQKGALGLITLNRPRALNSLTANMCALIHQQLDEWAVDDSVQAVMVLGAGEKAFCAGGDVVRVVKSYQSGGSEHFTFFETEYRMNVAIDEFPKPYISFADGITMGGGVGVSIPGDYWIATPKTLFAMPETGLGLFPDVGGGWFLPRLPGKSGMYLALTGARLKADDLFHLGIATHVMETNALVRLIEALAGGFDSSEALEDILAAYHSTPEKGPISSDMARIDSYFAGDSVDAILASLKGGDEWATKEAEGLAGKSPASMKLTFEQLMRGAAAATFRQNMQMEYRMVNRCVEAHDFPEGVRALLIDKDRKTNWIPSTLDGVSDDDISAYFAPLGDRELIFNS